MSVPHLGEELRRLRLQSDITLRGLATKLGISAAHLSDVEHNRRRPSEKLLRKMARELRGAGATLASLERLVPGIDSKTRAWAAATPGARALLRRVQQSGADPHEILRAVDKVIERKAGAKKKAREAAAEDKARKAGRKRRKQTKERTK